MKGEEGTQTTTQMAEKPEWIQRIENLLMALELYRVQQETALQNLTEILEAHEVDLSVDTLKQLQPKELQEQLRRYEERERGGR